MVVGSSWLEVVLGMIFGMVLVVFGVVVRAVGTWSGTWSDSYGSNLGACKQKRKRSFLIRGGHEKIIKPKFRHSLILSRVTFSHILDIGGVGFDIKRNEVNDDEYGTISIFSIISISIFSIASPPTNETLF